MATPLQSLTSRVMTQAIQTSLWLLRRYDYWINKSVASINNPNYYDNPYPTYGILRERGPILKSAVNRGWIAFGFDETKALLQDKRVSSDIRNNEFLVNVVRYATGGDSELPLIDNPSIVNLDAPDHTRLRKLLSQGFLHKYIQSLAPAIQTIIDEQLEEIDDEFDLVETLARPLPAIVIAEMMGVPRESRHKFEAWSEKLIGLTAITNPDLIQQAALANTEMRQFVADLVESKRANPGQDLITQLLAAEEDADKLSLDELYTTCIILLVAGHETTTRLISNCVYQLLKHPEQWQAIQQNRELLPNAIEESLRFDAPVQLLIRFAKENFEFHGKHIKKNQVILLSIGGANHDPKANVNPDTFSIHREKSQHLGFGHGIHLCLGMSLARLETTLVLETLLDRFPNLQLKTEKADWGTNDFFRGVTRLRLSSL